MTTETNGTIVSKPLAARDGLEPGRIDPADGGLGSGSSGLAARVWSVLPPLVTADALMAMELPEPRWAVPGILPEGLSILAGKPKLGKSWFCLGLGADIAMGGRALGSLPTDAGTVLYLALEDNRRRLQDRLAAILGGGPAPSSLVLATEWRKLDAGGLEAIEGWLRLHPETRVVFIDTFERVRSRRKPNANVYEEDYGSTQGLKELADRFQVAICLVHHQRKLEADDPVDTVSGSLGLTGSADAILILKRERGQHDAELFVTGRDVEEQELALKWDRERSRWLLAGDAATFRLSPERNEVIDVLTRAGGPMGPKAVAERLGKNYDTMRWLMADMVKRGEIVVVGRGLYIPTNIANNTNIATITSIANKAATPDTALREPAA